MATTSYITYGPGSPNYNPSGNNNYVSYDGGTPTQATGNEPGVIWNSGGGGEGGSTTTPDRTIPTSNVESTLASALYTPTQEEEIRKKFLDAVQPWVDTINSQSELMALKQQQIRYEQLGRNRAMLARSGLVGGTEEIRTSADIQSSNLQKENEMRMANKAKILEVQNEMRKMAEANISENKNLALKASEQKFSQANTKLLTASQLKQTEQVIASSKANMQQAADRLKMEQRDKSMEMLKVLGQNNTKWSDVPIETKEAFMNMTGLNSDMLELLSNSYKDQANKIVWDKGTIVKGKLVTQGINPLTGAAEFKETLLPAGMEKALEGKEFKDLGGGMLMFYETDANGRIINSSIVYDTQLAEYATKLKLQEINANKSTTETTNKISADTITKLSTAQQKSKWDPAKYQKLLSWMQTGSDAEVQQKEALVLPKLSMSISIDNLLSQLGVK